MARAGQWLTLMLVVSAPSFAGTTTWPDPNWYAGVFTKLPVQPAGELLSLIAGLSHPTAGGYGTVSLQRAGNFNLFVDALLQTVEATVADRRQGDWCAVQNKASAAGYGVKRFYDTTTSHWFIYAYDKTPYGQGYFLLNPMAKRDLVIQAPHVGRELNTDLEGARLFTTLAARALFLNKEDRCSDPDASACSGTTTACNADGDDVDRPYPQSDVAHELHNTFFLFHQRLVGRSAATRFLQLHGMVGSSTDVAEVSDGSQAPNSASLANIFAAALGQHVPNRSAVHSCQAGTGPVSAGLCAFTNVEGRVANGVSASACTTSTSTASGRFLNLEQIRALRDDDESDGMSWRDVEDALVATWPTCDLNGGDRDCTLGPAQTQPSPGTCP